MDDQHQELQDQALTPSEAAVLLSTSVEKLLAHARRGEVRGVYIGGYWRFSRTTLLSSQLVKAA